MQKIVPEIDEIVKEVSEFMSGMYEEFQQLSPDLNADYDKGAAMIVFRLGLDYFVTARDALHKGLVISGGALVRTSLENLADLFYIYDKPEKYPQAYVESMEKFRSIMLGAANKDTKELASTRELKQANKWTGATIEQRLQASGDSLINIYDLFSYFGHPNPGSLTYITNKNLKAAQLNLLKQSNCMTALTLMGVVLNHSDIQSIKTEELNVTAKKIGFKLAPDSDESDPKPDIV
jgi:hypothetical protein